MAHVLAQITGTVWKIEVQVGEEVEEDDVLIILECMKMEIPVEAPADGTVKAILVREGEPVQEDQLLIELG